MDEVCLSEALHLWAANPTEDDYKEMFGLLKKALALRHFHYQLDGWKDHLSISQWYKATGLAVPFPEGTPDDCYLKAVVPAIIGISIADYDFREVSQQEQKNHPLVDRTCEVNPVFKIFHFFHFVDLDFADDPPKRIYQGPAFLGDFRKLSVPEWIAPPCGLWLDMDRMMWRTPSPAENFQTLVIWGKLLDDFLQTSDDFNKFYYLLDVLWETPESSEYDFLKLFSLCELLLAREKTGELDEKLPPFLPADSTAAAHGKDTVVIMRRIRNKIAHGEFAELEKLLTIYRLDYMYKLQGRSEENFDFGEYSLRRWTLANLCGNLHTAVRNLLFLMLTDKEKLSALRNS